MAAARLLYRPRRPGAALGWATTTAGLFVGLGRPGRWPAEDLNLLLARHGIDADAGAVKVSPGRRLVLALGQGRRPVAVVKLAPVGDGSLTNELEVLRGFDGHIGSMRTPRVLWIDEWDGLLVMAEEVLPWSQWAAISVDRAVDICIELLNSPGAVGHGDLAPWNILSGPQQVGVIDWEQAHLGARPMHDVTGYVLAIGDLLNRMSPAAAVATLTGPVSPGARLLASIQRDPAEAPQLLREELTHRSAAEGGPSPFVEHMLDALAADP